MGWEAYTITAEEVVEHGPVATLTALFDDDAPPVAAGDVLPPLWHWIALPRWSASSLLGADGHPARGSFLPPIDLSRRMFAGGSVSFHSDIRVGSTVRRESTVESVTEKSGRSGPLVVVVVQTKVYDEQGSLALEERQDLIYREAGSAAPSGVSAEPASRMVSVGAPLRRAGDWAWDFSTDPTLLMRFSAATSNAHRIHYDWPYATQVEGYPGLVVHGPLMTLALAEVVRLERPRSRMSRVVHRNLRPLFCGQPARSRTAEPPRESSLELGLWAGTDEVSRENANKPNTTLTIDLDEPGSDVSEKGAHHA